MKKLIFLHTYWLVQLHTGLLATMILGFYHQELHLDNCVNYIKNSTCTVCGKIVIKMFVLLLVFEQFIHVFRWKSLLKFCDTCTARNSLCMFTSQTQLCYNNWAIYFLPWKRETFDHLLVPKTAEVTNSMTKLTHN